MRKSPLAKARIKPVEVILQSIPDRNSPVGISDQTINIIFENNSVVKVNLAEFYRFDCSISNGYVEGRSDGISTFIVNVREYIQLNRNQESLYSHIRRFKKYLSFCDAENIDGLSKEGYRAYVGNAGELRRLLAIASKPKPYLFLYSDGESLGLKEATALSEKVSIKFCLQFCDVFNDSWNSGVNDISVTKAPTVAYHDAEIDDILKRLTRYFYFLAEHILKEGATDAPPSMLKLPSNMDKDNLWDALNENYGLSLNNSERVSIGAPFNLAMVAGYYLFAYYTALNSTPILKAKLPIKVLTSKVEGRTVRHVSIKVRKGRGNKAVSGLFSDDMGVEEDIESMTVEVNKKDGLDFILTLEKLSMLYSVEGNGLFYCRTENHTNKPLGSYISEMALNKRLYLYAFNRSMVTDHIIEVYFMGVNRDVTVTIGKNRNNIVTRKEISISRLKRSILNRIASAAIRSMTDISLKNILIPLSYSDADESGNIEIAFKYVNGAEGKITTKSTHKHLFEHLEVVAIKYQSMASTTPTCLLFLGRKNQTYQTKTTEYHTPLTITNLGLENNDFYLELSPRKLRATTAENYINPYDQGREVSEDVLENTPSTFINHYADGSPSKTKEILSQGIQVIEQWGKDGNNDISKAIETIKSKLKIDVLAHDEWKALRVPTNPNGILCTGEPSPNVNRAYRQSQALAKTILSHNASITCYQFDQCIECKSAKLVNDIHSVYKLLSFIQLLENSVDRMPERAMENMNKAELLMAVVEENIDIDIIDAAEDKLMNEGAYALHNDDFILSMTSVGELNA